jgi:hypothetical protein
MKTFALPELSRLKLTKATPRKETHGKQLVQAISLRVEWWPTDNASVNLLHDNLQDLLWWVPPEAAAQAELEAGMRESLAAAGVKPKRGARAKVH